VDEARVRAAVAEVVQEDGTPTIPADQIADVLIQENEWLAVVLGSRPVPRARLARVHAHLHQVFPGVEIEVRAGGRVFRGGAGFGPDRHVLAVLGGKGGVGKSTVAVSLALTLSALGIRKVGVLDADLNGPDVPHLLGIHPRERPRNDWRAAAIRPPSERHLPYERLGLEVMSVGFMVSERAPLAATERWLVSGLLRNLLFDVAWTADVIVIDAPPGTGEEIQVTARELPLSGALFVTPQDLAQMDAQRTLAHLHNHGVPVIGMVHNMAWLTCPHCEHAIDLYASSERLQAAGVPILGRVPFDTRVGKAADRGVPLVLADPSGPIALEFARIGSAVKRWLYQGSQAVAP
jgi:ATP-binding protein involved in chromosome partitioning